MAFFQPLPISENAKAQPLKMPESQLQVMELWDFGHRMLVSRGFLFLRSTILVLLAQLD